MYKRQSDAQAQAIVDMRLKTLTGLEREKLENEYKDLMAQIDVYKRQHFRYMPEYYKIHDIKQTKSASG